MWIVDDDGDMFNTNRYCSVRFDGKVIMMFMSEDTAKDYDIFKLDCELAEERLTRYHDLVEKLTGERIDG